MPAPKAAERHRIAKMIERYSGWSNDRDICVMRMRAEGLTYQQIGKAMGVSQWRARDMFLRGHGRMWRARRDEVMARWAERRGMRPSDWMYLFLACQPLKYAEEAPHVRHATVNEVWDCAHGSRVKSCQRECDHAAAFVVTR